jgi:hypothetical protein
LGASPRRLARRLAQRLAQRVAIVGVVQEDTSVARA